MCWFRGCIVHAIFRDFETKKSSWYVIGRMNNIQNFSRIDLVTAGLESVLYMLFFLDFETRKSSLACYWLNE